MRDDLRAALGRLSVAIERGEACDPGDIVVVLTWVRDAVMAAIAEIEGEPRGKRYEEPERATRH